MSLDTLLAYLGIHRHDPHSLESQLQAMRHDVRRLSNMLGKQTGDWSDRAQEFGHMAASHGREIADATGKQALRGANMVRRDPLPAIAFVCTALLLSQLLKRR